MQVSIDQLLQMYGEANVEIRLLKAEVMHLQSLLEAQNGKVPDDILASASP